uniref:GH16 domain-containing protein n=1 Tax=Acrobeloides nanus TaxID=290746 RepID=A0A914DYL2_9BILA
MRFQCDNLSVCERYDENSEICIDFDRSYLIYSDSSKVAPSSCITTYTDLAIYGNDLNGVQGKPSSCCQLCQQKRGCKGWTWENFNGGTCWLKNDTQPLYKASQNGQITGIMSPDTANTYALNLTFDSTNFWDQPWHFDQWHSTNVTDKVNKTTAERLEMFGYRNGKIYMGAEHNLSYPHSGRPTVQIQSNYLFNSGLFVLSLDHMPTGPGVWPAFWMFGTNWPNDGEIDILEGVDNMTYNRVTIHTGNQCMMNLNDSVFFNGSWVNPKEYLECWQYFKPSK